MGSIDSAFGGNSEGGFEPDDFYESFLAPKFHDFTAPEEPIDPDAYFLSKPGMLKNAFAVEEVKTVAPKIQKVTSQDAPKTTPVSQQQAPPKSPVATEKTVRVGSAKKIISLSSPLTSKSLKNGTTNATNSPAQQQLPMLEKSLKPTSLAKKLQASENDDPNSPLNNPDVKAAKPALTRQRSQKAPNEVDKPTLTRQRSQKCLEAAKPTVVSQGDLSHSSNSEKDSDQGKGTPRKKEHPKSAAVSNGVALKASKPDQSSTCRTPVKDTVSNHPESKKCMEIVGSPYSGHHCKHARCAANDPNFASPAPTKKYLVAKKGTPGSIRKATPNHAGSDVSSESSEQSLEVVEQSSATGNTCGVLKVKGPGQVALEEAFDKISLEQNLVEEQVTKQVTVTTISDLKEVSLEEDKKQSLTAENIRDWSRSSVNCEEIAATSTTEKVASDSESGSDSKSTGVALFLQVASDCLENIDLNKLDVPPTKVAGMKRKSGEVLPAGASKKANCASGENSKAVTKKISQPKDSAASKTAKMKLRRLSVARRLSVVRSRPGVTNPRPFRLRTQERGAVKEKEFMKKMEEYKAAKEGFHSAFQGLAAVESKIPGKFFKSGHVFSAKRADSKDDKEVMKPTIPAAHKAPLFDHPFKPHRSTKKLTVPQEPKFHTVRGNRTCASHVVVPAA